MEFRKIFDTIPRAVNAGDSRMQPSAVFSFLVKIKPILNLYDLIA